MLRVVCDRGKDGPEVACPRVSVTKMVMLLLKAVPDLHSTGSPEVGGGDVALVVPRWDRGLELS